MQIITPRTPVEVVEYKRSFIFAHDPHSGFSFPCDADGNILSDALHPHAMENLRACLAGTNGTIDEGVRKEEWTYMEAAVGKCDCGESFPLTSSWANACVCGVEYNGMGQRLAPREQWEDDC